MEEEEEEERGLGYHHHGYSGFVGFVIDVASSSFGELKCVFFLFFRF